MIVPFEVPWDAEVVADLKRRLSATRWSDAVTADWAQRRAALNRLPHFRAEIDGNGVHFLHFRGRGAAPVPLLLMNGWPSSFVEYQRLAPLLADAEPSFEVVLPALPGFGFSDRPTSPYQVEPASVFPKLMTALGHERFMVAGTDIGSGVATRIALRHPGRVLAAHVSAVAPKPAAPGEPPLTSDEIAYAEREAIWSRDEGGYQAIQSSRPQTLAFALADSPAGMASWIVEKFRAWSDCRGDVLSVFPMEMLIDNLMVYWTTQTIGSSVRYYYEGSRLRPALKADDFVTAPTALGVWPHDLAFPPRELAARLYNLRRYTVFPRGGHFPAWEAPDLYAEDLRRFARDFVV
jgi:pimeloyl-ACP methyl ester carboxylesterase